jgi:hypothetical protein
VDLLARIALAQGVEIQGSGGGEQIAESGAAQDFSSASLEQALIRTVEDVAALAAGDDENVPGAGFEGEVDGGIIAKTPSIKSSAPFSMGLP